MKGSALFAAIIGIVNTITLSLCQLIDTETARQTVATIVQAISPFIALFVMRLYVKFDHPPELIRQEASLDAGIAVCKKHLESESGCSEEFRAKTQAQLEDLLIQKQRLRFDFERANSYKPTLPGVPD